MGKQKPKASAWLLEAFTFILLIIFMFPFYIVIINAAKKSMVIITSPLKLPTDWGQLLTNINLIMTNPNINYISSFLSSIIITFCSVAAIVISASMAAWVLVRRKSAMSNFIFMVFVAAMVIPFQVVMLPLVAWLRIIQEFTHIPLLRNYTGVIFAYMGFGSSLSIFLFHGFIKGVPYELEEAATIDGCTKPGTFFRIIFPIIRPIIVTVIILNGIWIWNDYLLPLMVIGLGNPIQTLPLAVANFVGSYVKKWDLILTATLMAMLPVVIVFLLAQKQIVKGMVDGSIK